MTLFNIMYSDLKRKICIDNKRIVETRLPKCLKNTLPKFVQQNLKDFSAQGRHNITTCNSILSSNPFKLNKNKGLQL